MKPSANDPGPDSRFEAALSGFRRDPLPPEWRDDLLDQALPGPGRSRAHRPLLVAVAAAWCLIAGLWLTSPSDRRPAATSPEAPSRLSPGTPAAELPMIAWRTGSAPSINSVLTP